MVLSPDGAAMTVLLSADRTETLDLMRRAIDSLASDLRDLGYGALNFRFDQSGHRSQRPDGNRVVQATAIGDVGTDAPAQNPRGAGFDRPATGVTQHLDIRL
jgi:hypothetical protein